jgi:hypothetical protein
MRRWSAVLIEEVTTGPDRNIFQSHGHREKPSRIMPLRFLTAFTLQMRVEMTLARLSERTARG